MLGFGVLNPLENESCYFALSVWRSNTTLRKLVLEFGSVVQFPSSPGDGLGGL